MLGFDARGKGLEDVASLLSTCRGEAEDSLDESTSGFTVRAVAAFSPEDGMPEGLFGGVIGWLNSWRTHEGPKIFRLLRRICGCVSWVSGHE